MIKIQQNVEIKKYLQYLLPVFLVYLYTDPIIYLTGWFNSWNYRISETTWLFQNLLLIALIGFALIGLFSLKQLDVFCLRFRWHYLAYLLLAFLAILGIQYGLVLLRLHLSANQSAIQDTFSRSQGDFLPYFLVLTCVLGPCLEELICRALSMRIYFKDSLYGMDLLVSASLFAFLHLYGVQFVWLDAVGFFLGGLVFALLFRLTKSIYYPLVLHIAWNTFVSWHILYYYFYFLFH